MWHWQAWLVSMLWMGLQNLYLLIFCLLLPRLHSVLLSAFYFFMSWLFLYFPLYCFQMLGLYVTHVVPCDRSKSKLANEITPCCNKLMLFNLIQLSVSLHSLVLCILKGSISTVIIFYKSSHFSNASLETHELTLGSESVLEAPSSFGYCYACPTHFHSELKNKMKCCMVIIRQTLSCFC